jgi:hypothetical protein
MSVFHGNWNEDAGAFLDSYLACMGSADDEKRARNFIYYLQADSDADEWFEELPEEEKRSWASIEVLFRRKWLEQEVIDTKKAKTIENGPQVSLQTLLSPEIAQNQVFMPHKPSDTPTMSPTMSGVSTKAKTTAALSQSPASFENRKNSKIHPTSEISSNFAVFSSPTSSVTSLESITPSTTSIALETRTTMAIFTQNCEKVENSSSFFQKTPGTLSPGIAKHTNDISQVHTNLPTPNNIILPATTLSTTASSPQSPASNIHGKSVLLRAVFEAQPPAWSLVPTTIVSALKTRPELSSLAKNYQKVEKLPIFIQKAAEPIVLGHSKRADDIYMPPAPTTIVSDLKTHSETAGFTEIHQKLGKSRSFIQKPTEPLVLELLNWVHSAYSLPSSPIAPTKHPCIIPGDFCLNFFRVTGRV